MADPNHFRNDYDWLRKTKRPLKVIIIGAGIGGLTTAIGLHKTGHQVIVLERTKTIAEVGAGIQAAPNAMRIFARLGLLEELRNKTNVLQRISVRRYANNEELSSSQLSPHVWDKFLSPMGVIHRGDLQGTLLRTALDLGIDIRTSHPVVEVDKLFAPRVKVQSGEWIEADFVVAADGIKSPTRAQMSAAGGWCDHILTTGDSIYRILIPRERMLGDGETLKFLDEDIGIRWIGPGGHVMAYPIQPMNGEDYDRHQNGTYNMALAHPSFDQHHIHLEGETWTTVGRKEEMLRFFSGWAPELLNLLKYAPEEEIMEWPLNMHRPLPTWVEGRIALLGDAAHTMLPYVAQGMANAVEDAGVLTEVFALTDDIDLGLKIYQHVRKSRAEKMQQSTLETQRALHMPDGAGQAARDQAMRVASKGGANPDRWSDQAWQNFMWGTDVMKIVRESWDELVAEVRRNHADMLGNADCSSLDEKRDQDLPYARL